MMPQPIHADVQADPHKPLRQDVHLLGALLGDALRARGGQPFFDTVERVRLLAKAAHAGEGDFRDLAALLGGLPVDAAMPLARAFTHFLNLANVAEQHHRIRRRRQHLRDPRSSPQRGSCDETFPRLLADGLDGEALYHAVCTLQIELVLTSHPTEVSRRTLIHKYNRIAALLAHRDRPDLTAPEQEDVEAALRREILSAWETDEVRHRRPSPLDEVRSGLIVFEQSLWHAVPLYLRGVDRALRSTVGRPLPLDATPVRFGSWIGGDRDGNPNVTAEVTRKACLLSRWVAADLYLREIEALRDELSMSNATEAVRMRVGAAREPYRELLREVRARLVETKAWIEASLREDREVAARDSVYLEAAALSEPLRTCYDSLAETGNGVIADGRLADLLRRLAVFGLTLARLDIRQASDRHTATLDAITRGIRSGSYAEWDEAHRVQFLTQELDNPRPLIPPDLDMSAEVADVLQTFRTVARIHPESLGAYVITMARSASDVLAVQLLQREAGRLGAGLGEPDSGPPLRVVPLFETAADLRRAADVLDQLFTVSAYRARIGGRQEVMVGYSDSAKQIGRLAAGWELYQAQEKILSTCRRQGVAVTLFHGRGGSVGRGGGPTYLAIQSQPSGSINGGLRVTEQGEMIQALFGLPDIAVRTMEVYTTGTLDSWLIPSLPPRPEWRDCMDRLAADAEAAYRGVLVRPAFLEYFHAATPIGELEGVNIGSRPPRRTGNREHGTASKGVDTLRAIPWQFAWTQTRLILGAWLGFETAVDGAFHRGEANLLRNMYRDWTHFRSVIDLFEMVLAKTDARIAAEYDRQLVPDHLRPIGVELRDRLARSIAAVQQITGHRELLEENAVLRRSIDVRNPYVDPINLVQVELVRRLRAGDDDERLRHAFRVTVNGIAAGMRNTG